MAKQKLRLNRIKAVLAEKDIEHQELAAMVKKTPSAITRICNNEFQPTVKVLFKIAQALDTPINELLVDYRTVEIPD